MTHTGRSGTQRVKRVIKTGRKSARGTVKKGGPTTSIAALRTRAFSEVRKLQTRGFSRGEAIRRIRAGGRNATAKQVIARKERLIKEARGSLKRPKPTQSLARQSFARDPNQSLARQSFAQRTTIESDPTKAPSSIAAQLAKGVPLTETTGRGFEGRDPLDVLPGGSAVAGAVKKGTQKVLTNEFTRKQFAKIAKVNTERAASALRSKGPESVNVIGKPDTLTFGGKQFQIPHVPLNTIILKKTAAILQKTFNLKGLVVLSIVGGWASSVYLGKWGQAESTEPIGITMTKYLIPNAQLTGDWSLVEEAQAARNEILDLEKWERIALWSPISAAIGIPLKIKGAITATIVQDKLITDLRIQQENGETEDQKFTRINRERIERRESDQADRIAHDKELDALNREQSKRFQEASIAFQNALSKTKIANKKKELRAEFALLKKQREEDQAFWDGVFAKREAQKLASMRAEAEFWTAYWKEVEKTRQENAPSNLNFGLFR